MEEQGDAKDAVLFIRELKKSPEINQIRFKFRTLIAEINPNGI